MESFFDLMKSWLTRLRKRAEINEKQCFQPDFPEKDLRGLVYMEVGDPR